MSHTNSEAQQWVESLDQRWRLQVLTKRTKYNEETGEVTELPVRIRRFVEGVPWALIVPSIDYLLAKAPYRGILFNGVELDGEYKPTVTTWNRDDRVQTIGDRSNDGTYTLIQDILLVGEDDTYGSESSSSCSEEVVSDWHWGETDIDALPPPEQGVVYSVQSVHRGEDGLFDYVIVRRRAITQITSRAVSADTSMSTAETALWDNVYTNELGEYVDHTGAKLDIPEAGAKDGTNIEVARSINADCTFRIQATWTTAKDQTVKTSTEKDQYSKREQVSKVGQKDPLPEAPEPSAGVVKAHENQLQPDGRYTTVEDTRTERPVTDSVVKVTVGRKGKRIERVDRAQKAPASITGLKVGQSVQVEKTPGALYNNTRVDFDLSERQTVGEACEETAFRHEHSRTEAGVDGIPGPAEHVEGSGQGGIIKTRQTQMDEEGAITQVNQTVTEKEVLKSRESWTVGLTGLRHSVVNTQTDTVPSPPTFSRENIGQSLVVEKTPGGLYNVTTESTDLATDVLTGQECSKTVFAHSDTKVEVGAGLEATDHVENAGNGVTHFVRSRINENGTVTVETTTQTELPVQNADVEIRKTPKATYRTVVHKNVQGEAQEPGRLGTSSHRTNPGGTRDLTTTSISVTGNPDRIQSSATVFQQTRDNVSVHIGVKPDPEPAPSAGGGLTYDKVSAVDDLGVVTTTLRTTQEIPQPESVLEYRKTPRALISSRTTKNSSTIATPPANPGELQRSVMTPGGLYDTTIVDVEATPETDRGYASESELSSMTAEVESYTGTIKPANISSSQGVVKEWSASMDENGIVTSVTRTTTSKPYPGGESYRKTPRALIHTTYEKNSADGMASPPTTAGGVVQATVNPDGTYDRATTEVEAMPEADRGYASESELSSMTAEVESYTGTIRPANISSSQGVVQDWSASMDENGIVTSVTRTTTSKPYPGGESYRKTPRALIHTTYEKNSADGTASPPTTAGGVVQATVNPDGTYDRATTEVEATPEVDRGYASESVLSSMKAEVESYTGAIKPAPISSSPGVVQDWSASMDENGIVTSVTRTTTSKQYDGGESYRKTPRALIHTVYTKNAHDGKVSPPESAGGVSQATVNPDGTYDRAVTDVEASPEVDRGYASADAFETMTAEVKSYTGALQPEPCVATSGQREDWSATMDENGIVTSVKRTYKGKAQTTGQANQKDHSSETEIEYKLTKSIERPKPAVIGTTTSNVSRMNALGLYETQTATVTSKPQEVQVQYTAKDFNHTYTWFAHQPSGHASNLVQTSDDLQQASVSVRMDEFGQESGSVHTVTDKYSGGNLDTIDVGWTEILSTTYVVSSHRKRGGGSSDVDSVDQPEMWYYKAESYTAEYIGERYASVLSEISRKAEKYSKKGYGVESYGITLFTSKTGKRHYRGSIRTSRKPVTDFIKGVPK